MAGSSRCLPSLWADSNRLADSTAYWLQLTGAEDRADLCALGIDNRTAGRRSSPSSCWTPSCIVAIACAGLALPDLRSTACAYTEARSLGDPHWVLAEEHCT